MNMKRVHANHIIAELTRRLADRDEEITRIKAAWEQERNSSDAMAAEITRLTALCQEPVDVDVVAVNLMRQFSVGKHAAREFAVAINSKLKEMT